MGVGSVNSGSSTTTDTSVEDGTESTGSASSTGSSTGGTEGADGSDARADAAQNTDSEQSANSSSNSSSTDYSESTAPAEDTETFWDDSDVPTYGTDSDQGYTEDARADATTTEDLDFELPEDQMQLLEDVRQKLQNAQNAKQLQQAEQVVPVVVEDVVAEETTTEAKQEEAAQEEKKTKEQLQQQALSKLPQFQLQSLAKQVRAKATQLLASAETAEEQKYLKDTITTRSQQIKQLAREQTERLRKSAFEFKEELANTPEQLFKALNAGGKHVKQQVSEFTKRAMAAQTKADELTPEQKLAIEQNTPEALKAGVGGEKDLTPKQLAQQRKIEEQRRSQEMAKTETAKKPAAESGAKTAATKSTEQKQAVEQDVADANGADPRKAVSIEHVARTVVPVLAQKSEQVRAKLEEYKKKGMDEFQAMVAFASGESFAAKGTENADEATLFEQTSAAFSDQMGRVQKFAGEKKQEAAQYAAATLTKASQLLQQGRSAVGRALVVESQARQDGTFEVTSNPANQTHLSEQELRSGYQSLFATPTTTMEAQNEPGQVKESTLAREFHQYWDGSVAQDMAGRFQSMFSDRKA